MKSLIGKNLQDGKYTLEQELGRGGFGITYIARHHYLSQEVVIKTLNPHLYDHPEFGVFQRKFQDEARRLALCVHPNIVRVSDFFTEASLPYMVMEYVPGRTLEAVAFPNHPLPEHIAIAYIRQVGLALTMVHQKGLLHRDITPQNIILRQGTQEMVLIDFGIAREFTAGVTQIHTSIASDGYAPIEQYLPQEKRTAATDVYGLAATLYALVTAQVPVPSVLRDRQSMPDPRDLQPQLKRATNQAILQGMAMEMYHRPQSVEAWLSLFSEPETPLAAVPQPSPPKTAATVIVAPQPQSQTQDQVSAGTQQFQSNSEVATLASVQPASKTRWPWLLAAIAALLAVGLGLVWARTRSPSPLPIAESSPENPTPTPSPTAAVSPATEPVEPVPVETQPPAESQPPESPSPPRGSGPAFPTGVSESAVIAALGEPTNSKGGFWPNTRSLLYKGLPGDVDMGYSIDRDSGRVRQTEASFPQATGSEAMQSTLSAMLGGSAPGDIQQGLNQVYQGQASEYSFLNGGQEGVIQRNQQGRIYIGVWDEDLH